MYYILLYIVSHIIWIYRGIPLHKKKKDRGETRSKTSR